MTCLECGTRMRIKRETYKYDASGLPGVTLVGIKVGRCPECKEVEVQIPNIEGLHRALALAIARKPERLTPDEIRFLRKYLGLSGTDFAQHLGVAAETVSRWEQGKTPMGTTADRLVRILALTREPISHYPLDMLKCVAKEDAKPLRLELKVGEGGWHPIRELAHAF
ncbi:MAG: type II TA system antitoxin MqsA family protein [Gammaproteobacteria bacterium]